MADYREISQEYAKGGIKTAIILNSGALLAILSQIDKLINLNMGKAVSCGVLIWTIGAFLGAISWLIGFFSTRYFDRYDSDGALRKDLDRSNYFMIFGILLILTSFILFFAGALLIALNTPVSG